MATTYHYEIVSMQTKDIGDVKDVVKKIEYAFVGTHESGYAADVFGMIVLDDPADPTTLTEYGELTEAQVQQWVKDLIPDDKELEMQASIDQRIEEQTGYNNIKPLPWAVSHETPENTTPAESLEPDADIAEMETFAAGEEPKGEVEDTPPETDEVGN